MARKSRNKLPETIDHANGKVLTTSPRIDLKTIDDVRLRSQQLMLEGMLMREKDESRFSDLEAIYASLGELKLWISDSLHHARLNQFLADQGDVTDTTSLH